MYYQATYTMVDLDDKVTRKTIVADVEFFANMEQTCLMMGATEVNSIHKTKYKEVIGEDRGGNWYKSTLADTFTDDNGKSKEICYDVLVNADTTDEALDAVLEYIKQGYDMKVVGISKTKISEVFD